MSQQPSGWGPEDSRPLPEPSFARKVAEDVWEGYFTLVVWALVLGLLALPLMLLADFSPALSIAGAAFTLAPGLAGLMVAAGQAARGGFARLGDAARGALRLYWRSVALALPLLVVLALFVITAGTIQAFDERQEMFISLALQAGVGLALAILHIYLLPVLALYDTSLKQTVRVSMALIGRHTWQTLALLALGAALLLGALVSHPLVCLLAGLIVPGLWSVVVMNATWRLTRQWPIKSP